MPLSKRRMLSFFSRYGAFERMAAMLPKKPVLLVLNYHRIGDPALTEYDAGVFSATAEDLDAQVRFLKRRFRVVGLDETLEMIERRAFRRAAVLLTFDDGYRDNYDLACPILASHGVQGVFFLPTAFIGTHRAAPWDAIAFIVRHARRRRFRLSAAPLREFDIGTGGVANVIGQVLDFYKTGAETGPEEFIPMLEEACDASRPDGSERLFMNWEEAAEMLQAGMAVESHTHSHPVLSQVDATMVLRELTESKQVLEERLNTRVRAIAYPFGLESSISPAVFRAAGQAGYLAGFSFYGGMNLPGAIEPFNIRREAVSAEEASTFQMRTSIAAVRGR